MGNRSAGTAIRLIVTALFTLATLLSGASFRAPDASAAHAFVLPDGTVAELCLADGSDGTPGDGAATDHCLDCIVVAAGLAGDHETAAPDIHPVEAAAPARSAPLHGTAPVAERARGPPAPRTA